MSVMRGIRVSEFGGPNVLKYVTDLPIPPKPSGRQLLVRVKSIGVNPLDTYIRTGKHNIKPKLPYIPGTDGAGIVEGVGELVTKHKKGDRVYWGQTVAGGYAELALTTEPETFTLHKNLSYQQGAALGIPYSTAYRALVTKAKLKPGETVFVHGASGAVGIASCQMARSLGAFVIGTAGTEEGMKLLLSSGAHLAFNHREDGYINKVKAAAKNVNVIVEMFANINLAKDLELLGPMGRITIIGSRGSLEFAPRLIMTNEAEVYGILIYNATKAEWAEIGAFLLGGQESGWLRPIIGTELPLDKAEQAHVEVIEHKAGTRGKIVLNV